MTPESIVHRRSYRLPKGYTVEFVWDGAKFSAEWSPDVPLRKMGRKILPHYQRARSEFLVSLDVPIVVVDL